MSAAHEFEAEFEAGLEYIRPFTSTVTIVLPVRWYELLGGKGERRS